MRGWLVSYKFGVCRVEQAQMERTREERREQRARERADQYERSQFMGVDANTRRSSSGVSAEWGVSAAPCCCG